MNREYARGTLTQRVLIFNNDESAQRFKLTLTEDAITGLRKRSVRPFLSPLRLQNLLTSCHTSSHLPSLNVPANATRYPHVNLMGV